MTEIKPKKRKRKGVSVFRRNDRNGLICVQWYVETAGKSRAKTQSFATMTDAKAFADSLRNKAKTHGKTALAIDPEKYRRFMDFEKKIGTADLDQVATVFQEWQQRQTPWKLGGTIPRYLELRLLSGRNEASHGHVKKRLARFLEFTGDVHLHQITSNTIQNFLSELKRSGEHGDYSMDNHVKTLRAFFRRAIREEWAKVDPTLKTERVTVEIDEVSVIPVNDAENLFASLADNPIAPRLALEAFGGLRNASAERLQLKDINFEDRGINLPAKKHKSGQRHYLENLPENLWAWLEKWRHDSRPWKMSEIQCMHAKSKAFVAAGISHPKNVLRHSFCSYHVALRRDAAETAILLQHTNPVTLYRHYKGRATARDASRYFAIAPK